MYYGDFVEDATVYIPFNTFSSDNPSASVTVTDLIASDVEIWKDGVIQSTAGAGVTVSVDIGTNAGSHLIAVDTSNTTDASFYVAAADYQVRINGATVDGATINAFVGSFSIQNRYMRGTDSAALAADKGDWATATGFATPTNITAGTITTATNVTTVSANGITATSMAADSINAASIKTDALAADGLAADAIAEIADAVWDELSTGHVSTGKAGQQLWTDIDAILTETDLVIASGTVTTNAQTTTFVISSGSAVADFYNQHFITIYDDSAGTYQTRVIQDYAVTTKTVTLRNALNFSTEGTVDTYRIWALSLAEAAIAGATATTYEVNDTGASGGTGLEGVYVWVTTDEAGSHVVAAGTTDSDGKVVFMLDSGNTYYVWKKLAGYTFDDNPESITAT